MPGTSQRSYYTGRTHVFSGGGTLTLHYCGGKDVNLDTPPPGSLTGEGWQGSNFFHPFDALIEQFHSIEMTVGIPGFGARIETRLDKSVINPVNGDPTYVTQIFAVLPTGTPVLATWYNENAPETVTTQWSFSVTLQEWAYEFDWNGTIRPSWTGAGDLYLRNIPAGQVALSVHGSTYHFDFPTYLTSPFEGTLEEWYDAPGDIIPSPPSGDYGFTVLGKANEPYITDMPYPNAVYAETTGFSSTVPITGWIGDTGTFVSPVNPSPASSLSFKFTSPTPYFPDSPGFAAQQARSAVDLTVSVQPAFRNWDGPINGVDVLIDNGAFSPLLPAPVLYHFGGAARRIKIPLVPHFSLEPDGWLAQNGYAVGANQPYCRWGTPYSALTLTRDSSLKVMDFAATPPMGYDWDLTDCTKSVVGSALEVVASGSNPVIYRDLKSDLQDILADSATWFPTYGASVIIPGMTVAEFSDWWNGVAVDPSHINYWEESAGDLNRIGRRLLPISDYTNYSSWRFLAVRAKADTACDITLRLHTLNSDRGGSGNVASYDHVDYTVSLTDTMADHTVDTAGWPVIFDGDGNPLAILGHFGLRYVSRVEVRFPAGRTLDLESLTMFGTDPVKIDVHSPGTDAGSESGMIAAYGDGKLCLFIGQGHAAADLNSSFWGWPVKKQEWLEVFEGIDFASSMLCQEVAWDLTLQEGWRGRMGSRGPDTHDLNGAVSFAVWLQEAFGGGGSLMARKSYRSIWTYPGFPDTLTLELNLGHGTKGLVFDDTTHAALLTLTTLETPTGASYATPADIAAQTEVAHGFSDRSGVVAFSDKATAALDLRAHPAPPGLPIDPPTYLDGDWKVDAWPALPRTIFPAAVAGTPGSGGAGSAVLDVDRSAFRNVVYVPTAGGNANTVVYARQRGVQTDWEYFPLAVANDPWVHVDEIHPAGRIYVVFQWGGTDHNISAAYSDQNGTGGWSMAAIGTGTKPFIRIDKSNGRKYVTYWRSNNVYLRICPPFNETWGDEIGPILSGVDENVYTFDWLKDDPHTMMVVYSDGTTIQSVVSVDDGLTWS